MHAQLHASGAPRTVCDIEGPVYSCHLTDLPRDAWSIIINDYPCRLGQLRLVSKSCQKIVDATVAHLRASPDPLQHGWERLLRLLQRLPSLSHLELGCCTARYFAYSLYRNECRLIVVGSPGTYDFALV